MMTRENLSIAYMQIVTNLPLVSNSEEKSSLLSLQAQIAVILEQGEILRSELACLPPDAPQLDIIKLFKDAEIKTAFFTFESTQSLQRRVRGLLKCQRK